MIPSDEMDLETCDRCGHVCPAHLVRDTFQGMYCRDCRRALGMDVEDDDLGDNHLDDE